MLEHSFNDALKVRNATRFYDYQLDRFNTLSNGNINAAALTVQLSRSAIFRKESGWFNQTDFNYKTTFGGMKHEILFGAELGQQKNGWRLCRREYSPPCPFLTPGVVTPPAFTAAQLNANPAIASNTVQDVFGLYVLNQITLAKNWKALVGIRFDQFKQDTNFEKTLAPLARVDSNYSPRAGLVWQPGDSQSYYVSYSRSYQPSAESFALAVNSAANAPEVTRNLEVGTKRLSGRCAKCQCCTV